MQKLAKEFRSQALVIEEAFQIVDECIDIFNQKAGTDEYHRVCGFVLVKARNLALGAYGLILDGLGQEAGALLRPFIEYHELLTYFRLEPKRVQQAINNDLPSAGKRAQLIEGYFHEFRKYLNDSASHSSFCDHSMSHLLDEPEMTFRKEQPMLPKVLFRNMGDIFVQLLLMTIEAINCLQTAKLGCAEIQAEAIDSLRLRGIDVFMLNERVSKK